MSVDAARGFFREMISDDEFRDAVNNATEPEQRTRLAADAGFEFTIDDLELAIAELAQAETVGDLLEQDEVTAYALGNFIGLENHTLMAPYGDGAAPKFFQQRGQMSWLKITPPAIKPGG
jgi:predicted ribosomally synthesized peptide with nif11-like leader